MKRRLSAVLLALGLTVSALSMGVYAEETETAATEQVTEATTDAAAEVEEDLEELESEAAETETLSQEEQLKAGMEQTLTEISGYTEEQLAQMLESDNTSTAAIAMNWKSVKEELGAFEEITGIENTVSEDYTTMTIVCHAKYEKVDDKTDVVVTYEANQKTQSVSMNWEINYTMGKKMEQAGLNTVMGLGIVFLTLLFLSFLIAQLHFIPDMIEKFSKKEAPAEAPKAAPAPVAAVEEEDLTDDLELVAVITAAIAASENTSSDGFVVRSIKKANKRNWQRA